MKTFFNLIAIAILAIVVLCNCQSKETAIPKDKSNETIDKTDPDHFNTVVGEDQNGEYVLDEDIDDLIANWETNITNGALITIDFDNVSIELEDSKYFLVGVDDSENATSKIRLVLDSGTFYEIS